MWRTCCCPWGGAAGLGWGSSSLPVPRGWVHTHSFLPLMGFPRGDGSSTSQRLSCPALRVSKLYPTLPPYLYSLGFLGSGTLILHFESAAGAAVGKIGGEGRDYQGGVVPSRNTNKLQTGTQTESVHQSSLQHCSQAQKCLSAHQQMCGIHIQSPLYVYYNT